MVFSRQEIASWPENHRRCTKCLELKPFDSFHKCKSRKLGVTYACKECLKPFSVKSHQSMPLEKRMLRASKMRANKNGIVNTLRIEDINIPERCPVLGVPIVPNTEFGPSLDRVHPELGYIPSNVRVISKRANLLKNNATLEEMRLVLRDLEGRNELAREFQDTKELAKMGSVSEELVPA